MISPHVVRLPDNTILIEWWGNKRKLSLYIDDKTIDYIKITNAKIDDMKEGIIENSVQLRELLTWVETV